MAQLKEIRSRIASIKNTRQVTSAMKMVSAAKLKKAQDAILQITPYDKKLTKIIQNLSLGEIDFDSVFFTEPKVKKVLLVVIGGNRGLCGGFNSNISKFALHHAQEKYSEQFNSGNIEFLTVGRQVEKHLKNDVTLYESQHDLINDYNYEDIAKVAIQISELFANDEFQQIDIGYNKFKNAGVQELTIEQFLPIEKPNDDNNNIAPDYIYEPSQEDILTSLIPQSLKMRLYRVLLDSNAAENGARMTAMHQATDNATELLKDLQTTYNNARQASITSEILEIVSGAEALNG